MKKYRTKEERKLMFSKAEIYSPSLLKDFKHDDEWVRTIYHEGKTWACRSYAVWNGIRSRCTTGGSFQRRFPHYVGTTVCSEWDDFEAFADWYTNQVGYEQGWDVDKDVLSGSKHYSPATCLLLPRSINLLFGSAAENLNVVSYKVKDGSTRWKTNDATFFPTEAEAKEWARELRLKRLESLKQEYPVIPEVVFEKAYNCVPCA